MTVVPAQSHIYLLRAETQRTCFPRLSTYSVQPNSPPEERQPMKRFAFPLAAASTLGAASAQITDYTPVTDELLANPPAESWLTYRQNLQGWGFSPLHQI